MLFLKWVVMNLLHCQAIGRVIRHKDDYGCVLLCDDRFSQSQLISEISDWAKEAILPYTDYKALLKRVSNLFDQRKSRSITSLEEVLSAGQVKCKSIFEQKSSSDSIKEKAAAVAEMKVTGGQPIVQNFNQKRPPYACQIAPSSQLTSFHEIYSKRLNAQKEDVGVLRSPNKLEQERYDDSKMDIEGEAILSNFLLEETAAKSTRKSIAYEKSGCQSSVLAAQPWESVSKLDQSHKKKIVIKEQLFNEIEKVLSIQQKLPQQNLDSLNIKVEESNKGDSSGRECFGLAEQKSNEKPLLRLKQNNSRDSFSSSDDFHEKRSPKQLFHTSLHSTVLITPISTADETDQLTKDLLFLSSSIKKPANSSSKKNDSDQKLILRTTSQYFDNLTSSEDEGKVNATAEFSQRRSKSVNALFGLNENQKPTDGLHQFSEIIKSTRNSAPLSSTTQQLQQQSLPLPLKRDSFDKVMLCNRSRGLGSFSEGDIIKLVVKNERSPQPQPTPTDKISPSLISDDKDSIICPVCYEPPKNNHWNPKCKHYACYSCWEKWLSEKLECPMCRVRCRIVYLEPYAYL